jgi:hypothetical protein
VATVQVGHFSISEGDYAQCSLARLSHSTHLCSMVQDSSAVSAHVTSCATSGISTLFTSHPLSQDIVHVFAVVQPVSLQRVMSSL